MSEQETSKLAALLNSTSAADLQDAVRRAYDEIEQLTVALRELAFHTEAANRDVCTPMQRELTDMSIARARALIDKEGACARHGAEHCNLCEW